MSFSASSRGPSSFVLSDLEQQKVNTTPEQREAFNAALNAVSRLSGLVGTTQHDISVSISGHINPSAPQNDYVSLNVSALDAPVAPEKVPYADDALNAAAEAEAPPEVAPEEVDPLTEGGA